MAFFFKKISLLKIPKKKKEKKENFDLCLGILTKRRRKKKKTIEMSSNVTDLQRGHWKRETEK